MKRAIITGATGAIGRALINELTSQNIEVLVWHRRNSRRLGNIPNHSLVTKQECDLVDLCEIKNDGKKSYDVFFHLAWDGTFGEMRNDMYRQTQNIKFALDAVGAAKRFGCKLFIGVGSQAEYGIKNEKLTAQTPVNPTSGYGMAKLCAGQMTREYATQLGLGHIWARVLSVYGVCDGENTMIMSALNKFLAGETPDFTAAEQIWDYLYAKDAAKALILLAKKGKCGKTYVLGSGAARPLKEYIEEIRDIVAPHAKLNFGVLPYGKDQIMYLCADTSEIEEDTGWRTETKFADGIKEIIQGNL